MFFLSQLIVLIEEQLNSGWRFSGCLGLIIERNICINNSRKCFFCTDYDLSRENPGYINKGDQFCLFVGNLINNIEIFQYNKFKNNSPLSQNAIFYGKIVRMFASNLLIKKLGISFHDLFVDIQEAYYNYSLTPEECDPDIDDSVQLDVLYDGLYPLFSNYYLAFRKEDSKFFFLDCDYDKNYPNFLPPGSHVIIDFANFFKKDIKDFAFETSLFKLIFLYPITKDFSKIKIFDDNVQGILLEAVGKLSAQNLLVSNDSDLISCIKCGEIPLYPELRDLVPNYPEDAYPEYLYKNI